MYEALEKEVPNQTESEPQPHEVSAAPSLRDTTGQHVPLPGDEVDAAGGNSAKPPLIATPGILQLPGDAPPTHMGAQVPGPSVVPPAIPLHHTPTVESAARIESRVSRHVYGGELAGDATVLTVLPRATDTEGMARTSRMTSRIAHVGPDRVQAREARMQDMQPSGHPENYGEVVRRAMQERREKWHEERGTITGQVDWCVCVGNVMWLAMPDT
jgi:hypothetical protein